MMSLTQRQRDQYKEVAFGNNPDMKDMAKERLREEAGSHEWTRVSHLYRENYDSIRWDK